MANQKKQQQVTELIDILKANQHFSLLKFDKTSHLKMELLRKALKKSGSKIKVVKNSLFQKAISKLSQDQQEPQYKSLNKQISSLKDNSALLTFGDDWSAGMNIFFKYSQDEKSVSFRVGCLDKTVYASEDLLRIAQLPSKSELLGKILGSMKSPVAHFTNAIKYNTQKFVYILNAKGKKN